MFGNVYFKLVNIVSYIYYIMTTMVVFIVVWYIFSQIITRSVFAACFAMNRCD